MNRIIIAGHFIAPFYEEALLNAFKSEGWEVKGFNWTSHRLVGNFIFTRLLLWIYYKFTDKYLIGPEINRINNSLIYLVQSYSPTVLFIHRGTHIISNTIKRINNLGVLTISYNNDDPFGNAMHYTYWRHFSKSIHNYHLNFVYRPKNIDDYNRIGVFKAIVLKPYFINSSNFKIEGVKKIYDLVFIGHYEDDGRDELLIRIIKKRYKVAIFGNNSTWRKSKQIRLHDPKIIIKPAVENYNLVLNQSLIALNFLSKLNNDVYTRRCFEIPASGTLLLSEYTDALSSLLTPDLEAVYFHNVDDAIVLFEELIKDNYKIESISRAGHKKMLLSKHEVKDRVREIINVVEEGY